MRDRGYHLAMLPSSWWKAASASLVSALIAAASIGDGSMRAEPATQSPNRPNVLFIILDDLNDWIEPLGGHPQASTPTMAALARRGVTFANAHTQAPLCNPSRASFLTGLRPSTMGIYGLAPGIRNVEALRSHVTMPQFFTEQGYATASFGKVFHDGVIAAPDCTREFETWGPAPGMPYPPTKFATADDTWGQMRVMDWGPGVPQRVVRDPVELLDIYPTLLALAGHPARLDLEGQSLVPQFRGVRRTRPAITTHNQGNHAVRTDRWRYVRYADGSEELYDHRSDPNEWTNLAGMPRHASMKRELAQWLPAIDCPPVPGSASRVLTRGEDGTWLWEGQPIVPSELVR